MAEDPHQLSAAYAALALEPLQEKAFEAHLADCEDCRVEVAGFRETLVRLAEGVALAPPAALRERVLARIAVTPQLPPLVPQQAGAGVPTRRSSGWAGHGPARWWLAAAAAVIVAAGGAGVALRPPSDGGTVAAIDRVTDDPAAQRRTVRVGGGSATLVVAGSGVVLTADGLPAPGTGKVYQLWLIRPGQPPRSAGLGPAPARTTPGWSRLVDGAAPGDTVALTVEPDGGSAQPTSTPLAAIPV